MAEFLVGSRLVLYLITIVLLAGYLPGLAPATGWGPPWWRAPYSPHPPAWPCRS